MGSNLKLCADVNGDPLFHSDQCPSGSNEEIAWTTLCQGTVKPHTCFTCEEQQQLAVKLLDWLRLESPWTKDRRPYVQAIFFQNVQSLSRKYSVASTEKEINHAIRQIWGYLEDCSTLR